MRTFLAIAMAASLFVAAGCSCAIGDCNTCEAPAPTCDPCGAPAPVKAPVVIKTAAVPVAVAPITCNPCAGL